MADYGEDINIRLELRDSLIWSAYLTRKAVQKLLDRLGSGKTWKA